MSKKELERKHREEQEATAHAFQEFIQTFQDNSGPPNKLFVKSGILYAKDDDIENERGRIYNPRPIVKQDNDTIKKAIECARLLKESKMDRGKGNEKPKSNLELLKEELRLRHLERDERIKSKAELTTGPTENVNLFESDDQSTTNLFVANINPNMTEQDLMHIFGAYGPLASVKIMWPRGDERVRNNNVGFVAYMSRKDGERALENLKNRDDMRIGWGKPVEIPAHPVYIPPELLKLLLPPPQSGLPFNAQTKIKFEYPRTQCEMDELLRNSIVNVTIPLDKKILSGIHRMIEFLVREGPLFEAMIMNKEINNPMYQFLFDTKSSNHVYYRWKLYSIAHGEAPYNWSTNQFRMFKGGSIWVPPVIPNYTTGMPESLYKNDKVDKKMLSQAQRHRLIQCIQGLNANRLKIGEAMVFCMNHEAAAKDVVNLISESFDNDSTSPVKKIARFFLLSDILYNSGVKRVNKTNKFVEEIQKHLTRIFELLEKCHGNLSSAADKNTFKSKICKVLRSWDLWRIYKSDFVKKLEKTFVKDVESVEVESDDEPLDGKNLIKRSLQNVEDRDANNSAVMILNPVDRRKSNQSNLSGFMPCKWESVNPEDIEAQAMSTKKLYDLEFERQKNEKQSKKLSEQERGHLRKIEVMVMHYQDDLESGNRKRKRGKTIEEEIAEYRKELLESIKNNEYRIRKTSPISNDSLSSDEDRREHKRSKKYKKKDHRDRDKYKRNR